MAAPTFARPFAMCSIALAVFLLVFIFPGCASNPDTVKQLSFESGSTATTSTMLADLGAADRKAVTDQLNAQLAACDEKLGKLAATSQAQIQSNDLWLVTAIIASGIVSPALLLANAHANAVTIAAVNGYSATATYIAKNNESTNQNGTFAASTHNDVVAKLKTDLSQLDMTTATVGDAENTMLKMSADCTLVNIGVPSFTLPAAPATNAPPVTH